MIRGKKGFPRREVPELRTELEAKFAELEKALRNSAVSDSESFSSAKGFLEIAWSKYSDFVDEQFEDGS